MDDTSAKFKAWWASLTTKAKKAIIRRQERKSERQAHRTAFLAAGTSGYCCPKCYRWHPTPAGRRECRDSHRKVA